MDAVEIGVASFGVETAAGESDLQEFRGVKCTCAFRRCIQGVKKYRI